MAKKNYTKLFREQFCITWLRYRDEESFSAHCERFGVSRETAYDWLARYQAGGAAGLETRSSAPLTVPHRTDEEMVKMILALRERHPTWGPKKLKVCLANSWPEEVTPPAASTIGSILKRAGVVVSRKRRKRIVRYGTSIIDVVKPNDVWTTDFKGHFRTLDKKQCYPLTLVDNYSRFILRCDAYLGPDERTRRSFESAFVEYGLPKAIRSDNGTPFAAAMGPGGLSTLSVWWIRLGILPERITPASPWENGRHERMHRTLKAEATQPPQANRRRQQRTFDSFVHEFNYERPHEALAMQTPSSVYVPSHRPYSRKLIELEYPKSYDLRRVSESGTINWDGERVLVSKLLSGQIIGLHAETESEWQLHFGPVRIGSVRRAKDGLKFQRARS